MARDLFFDLSPMQSAFVHSTAQVAMLMGSMGEGKTYAGGVALVAHAGRCKTNIRAAIIRDTHQNMKVSTVPDLQRMFGARVSFHDDCKRMVIDSRPRVDVDLFGIDDPAALSKLQGPQYAMIWLEEPAPILDRANAGLPRSVFSLALARAARQEGTLMRVQITQNPADEDHWTEELFNAPDILIEDAGVVIRKECFRIPYGDNRFLNAHTRAANKAAFQDDPGKYARYVEGRAAPVKKGESVTPQYNPLIHFSTHVIPVVPGAMGVRGYDAWHHPCIIVSQFVPPGRLIIHDAIYGENIGVIDLIEGQLKTLLASPKYSNGQNKPKIPTWRDIGDPSMRTPDQSRVGQVTAKLLEKALSTRFESGPVKPIERITPIQTALRGLANDGQPLVVVSRSAYPVHRAFNGGWHYPKDNSGKIGDLPVKDQNSHVGDAAGYMFARIFPAGATRRVKATNKSVTAARMAALAESYGHSRPVG